MKKSLRLLVATIFMAAAVTAASNTTAKGFFGAGADPMGCPPGVCAVSAASTTTTVPNAGADPMGCPPGVCAQEQMASN